MIVQTTLPTKKEWIHPARIYCDLLSHPQWTVDGLLTAVLRQGRSQNFVPCERVLRDRWTGEAKLNEPSCVLITPRLGSFDTPEETLYEIQQARSRQQG